MKKLGNVKDYYRQITEVDIGPVARELLGSRITHESGPTLLCDCPNHQSQSHKSLQVNTDQQLWHCFGCGVGGDVLQLVEFIKSGTVTKGISGSMPPSHRQARDYLAKLVGLPPLSSHDIPEESIRQAEEQRLLDVRVQDVLTELSRFYHARLKANEEALAWLQGNYGVTPATIDRLLIGFADNTPWKTPDGAEYRGPIDFLTRLGGFTDREITGSGAFHLAANDGLYPFFEGRIMFPYWSRGRVAFLIGRKTPWTPDKHWEEGKYKKLQTHNDTNHKYVAPCVYNGYIYNEDCLLAKPSEVLITEGVTDCIAAMQCGISCISPVTVRFRKQDAQRLIEMTEHVKRITICNDSEESGAGEKGALKTAELLHAAGRNVYLATIPKPMDREKIDINDLVLQQGEQGLREVLNQAKPYIDSLMDRIPKDQDQDEFLGALEPLLKNIVDLPPLKKSLYLDKIVERFGVKKRPLAQTVKLVEKSMRHAKTAVDTQDDRPTIRVDRKQLSEIIGEASNILVHTNQNRISDAVASIPEEDSDLPPLFQRAGTMVTLKSSPGCPPELTDVGEYSMFGYLARDANWIRKVGDELMPVFPPKDVAHDLIAYPPGGIPRLDAVITTPIFGQKGNMVTTAGYHKEDHVWLHLDAGLDMPEVPKNPTPSDIQRALTLFVDDLFVDFPFVDQSDRTHALAALLLPFVRLMIQGCTPLHVIEAPSAGSGKGLISNLISIVATGKSCDGSTLPQYDDEVRKKITAELCKAQPLILLDNAREGSMLDSPSLASVLTSAFWTDRILGKSEMVTMPNLATWILTGNNPKLSMEIARRCVRIRIDPKRDRAWTRTGFKHDPITEWAKEHRTDLVHGALTLIQTWIVSGCPLGKKRLGSYEHWAGVMDGIMDTIGVQGFLGNLEDLYEAADVEGSMWRDFVNAWWEEFRGQEVRIHMLNDLCERLNLLEPVRGDRSPQSQNSRLGLALGGGRDRVYGSYRITLSKDLGTHKGKMYSLTSVSDGGTESLNLLSQANVLATNPTDFDLADLEDHEAR